MLIFIPGILLFQRMQGMLKDWEYWALLLLDCYLLYDQRFESLLRPAAVLFASICIRFLSIEHPIWKWLGSISYSLYLIHLPVGWSFMNMAKIYTQDETMLSAALIFAVLLSIGVAYLFYRFIETPSQIWAKRILDKQKGLKKASIP
jgi:peptidoglycan/LPS O-acetylase OafA/YrhL